MYKILASVVFLFIGFFLVSTLFSTPVSAQKMFRGPDAEDACNADCTTSCSFLSSSGEAYCPSNKSKSVQAQSNLFGVIALPPGITKGVEDGGLVNLLTAVLRLMVVAAGIYALFNFVIAGYQFMNAGGDSKAVSSAWARIWQSMIGVVVVASAFLFAALIGKIFFGSAGAILNPTLYTP